MRFEWAPGKAAKNLHKHKVVFVKRKEQHFLIENDSTQWV
jgi:uncharacterized DUF497 family protein